MNKFSFKKFCEMAEYGKEPKGIMGGTEVEPGDELFHAVSANRIMSELLSLPAIGQNNPVQPWECTVEWGKQIGAIRAESTTFGSLRVMTRKKIFNLLGEEVWICKSVRPISDVKDEDHEKIIANEIYDNVTKISAEMAEAPSDKFEDFSKLAKKMWSEVTRTYPSYCMFPVKISRQNENYYKMVFEFRGGGQGNSDGGCTKQFSLDLIYEREKGTIRCWGYNISLTKGGQWAIEPSEWEENFSPNQQFSEIIKCVVEIFLQY